MTNAEHYSDYRWIKVKRHTMDESKSWEDRYKDLDDHHIKETTFLINEVRVLADQLDKVEVNERWMDRSRTFFVMWFGFMILAGVLIDSFVGKEYQYQNPWLILVAISVGLIGSGVFCLFKWRRENVDS